MYDRKAAGKRMQELRKRKGITQESMGEDIGFTRSKISNLETGRRDVCMTDAILICDYFEVSLENLFYSKSMSSDDFLIMANNYLSDKTISKKERRKTLKKILDYL